jgi:SagB-type dehydrogenase family enzyme
VIHGGAGAALVAALVRPHTYPDLSDSRAGLTADAARVFVGMLASAGAITRLPEDASIEDEDANLAQWEFHDLFFHSRSRQGRHDRPFGGTYPFLGRIEPLPAVKPKPTGERFVLHRPDLEEAERNDPPLGRVLDERRSIRAYASEPVSAEQLGEFLYRVARVRSVEDADPTQGRYYALSRRPYPSGGATYDLELYVTINVCTRLPPGLYHYDPLDHELRKLSDRDERVEALLHYASMSTGVPHLPQVLITLASRFQRLSWKYRSMAYATTLKNVGVLYQTMYLVATAMGLAPCALGGGNSDVFAEAAGTDYYAESSVGEFVLGSVPDDA